MVVAVISLMVVLLILSYLFFKIYGTEVEDDEEFDTNKVEEDISEDPPRGHSQYCRRTCRCMCYRCVADRRDS